MGAPGCDDAPVVSIPQGEGSRVFTLVLPYYENPMFFRDQLNHLEEIAAVPWFLLELIVVDDGSPENPAEKVLRQKMPSFPCRLFRIDVDVRWNWLAARNIGAHYARTKWLMLTDMDHMLPVKTAWVLATGLHDEKTIYRFSRIGSKTHPHPNSWFMTWQMFWKVGGYDEALSGHYGTDGEYRRRCAATAPILIMDVPLELHEYSGDSSTTHYKRKQPEDARGKQIIKSRKPGWKPRVLSFPYHEVDL